MAPASPPDALRGDVAAAKLRVGGSVDRGSNSPAGRLRPHDPGAVLLRHGGAMQALAGGDAALFVTLRQYDGVTSAEGALPLLVERTLPAIERQPGFRGLWAFRDERDPAHAVSVSVWDGRGAAFAAHQRALVAVEGLRQVFPAPPKVTAGAARLVAA